MGVVLGERGAGFGGAAGGRGEATGGGGRGRGRDVSAAQSQPNAGPRAPRTAARLSQVGVAVGKVEGIAGTVRGRGTVELHTDR